MATGQGNEFTPNRIMLQWNPADNLQSLWEWVSPELRRGREPPQTPDDFQNFVNQVLHSPIAPEAMSAECQHPEELSRQLFGENTIPWDISLREVQRLKDTVRVYSAIGPPVAEKKDELFKVNDLPKFQKRTHYEEYREALPDFKIEEVYEPTLTPVFNAAAPRDAERNQDYRPPTPVLALRPSKDPEAAFSAGGVTAAIEAEEERRKDLEEKAFIAFNVLRHLDTALEERQETRRAFAAAAGKKDAVAAASTRG
ncbi:hypothetical protein VTH06DRAFT_7508 [Thermothelomyces fergusii]